MHRSHPMEEMHRNLVVWVSDELANIGHCMNRFMQYSIGISVYLHAL